MMTDDSSRECGGEVNQSSSMSNPDPSRAALADELLPCPFCGGPPQLSVFYEDGTVGLGISEHASEIEFVVIRCPACGISAEKPSTEYAVKWWDTRAPLPGRLDCGAGNRSELLDRAEKYININAPDGRGSALLVMELADALRAFPPTLNSGADDALEEKLARAIRHARELNPNTLYQHLGDDFPIDCTDSAGRTFYKAWRKEIPSVRAVLAALPRAVQGGAGKTQFLTGWMTDQHDAALSPNTGDGGATERLWCTACGTVTRDRLCDCNRWGDEREPHFVNYADEMQKTAHEQAQEIEAWRQAMREMRDLAIDEKSEAIEMRCYDLIMHGPAVPRSDGGAL